MADGIILLYCIATAVAIISRRIRVPYSISLLVVGLALGASHLVELPRLTQGLLFTVFLPGLLFEAAYHLEVDELRANARSIAVLAVPGVIVAILLTATLLMLAVHYTGLDASLGWQASLLFGCVIAATDPVAVTALFREVRAPRRLHVLVESESLFNDGTSIVFLTLMLSYLDGTAPTPLALVVDFVRITMGGVAIGFAIAWCAAHIRARLDDASIEITLTTIAAYASFIAAEHLHCSGVIATVVAGIVCGRSGRRHPMNAKAQAAVNSFWEWLAFALNSAVFVLLGAEISLSTFQSKIHIVLLAAAAALAARCVVVALTRTLLQRSTEGISRAWAIVLGWGGLRGALSLVLALSLPPSIDHRDLIIVMVAGTVITSLVGQGLAMPALLRRLGISGDAAR